MDAYSHKTNLKLQGILKHGKTILRLRLRLARQHGMEKVLITINDERKYDNEINK